MVIKRNKKLVGLMLAFATICPISAATDRVNTTKSTTRTTQTAPGGLLGWAISNPRTTWVIIGSVCSLVSAFITYQYQRCKSKLNHARNERAQLGTEIKGGLDTACQERTRLQTSVDGNGRAISELTKQENLHHQTAVQERGRLHAVSQRSIQANGNAIGLVQTSINDLSRTEAQHHTEHLQRFDRNDALVRENRNATKANGAAMKRGFDKLQVGNDDNRRAISELTKQGVQHHQDGVRERAVLQKNTQAKGDAIELVRTNLNTLRTAQTQDHNENQLKLQTLEEQLVCASQERANMTATLTDNSGQLSGLTETQKQLKLLLQQQSQTHTQQLTRIEEMIRLSNQQLAHHFPLQRRPLLWPSPSPSSSYALFLSSATTALPRAQIALKQNS